MKYKPFHRRRGSDKEWKPIGYWQLYDDAFETGRQFALGNRGRDVLLRDKDGKQIVIWRLTDENT